MKSDPPRSRNGSSFRRLAASAGEVPSEMPAAFWQRLRLFAAWGAVAGPVLARQARPETLDRAGVLTVIAASTRWAKEIEALEPLLLSRLGERSGARVNRLQTKVVPSDFPRAGPEPAHAGAPGAREAESLNRLESSPPGAQRDDHSQRNGHAEPTCPRGTLSERLGTLRDRYLQAAARAGGSGRRLGS